MMVGLGDLPRCEPAPDWCNWMPFADYFGACKPLTPEEQDMCQRSGFAERLPVESQTQAIEEGRRRAEAYCRLHPDECDEWRASVDCPSWAATLGPWAASAICGETGLLASGRIWLYLLGGGLVLALLVRR